MKSDRFMEYGGQALLETIISIPALILTLMGATHVLHSQWQRVRCAYLVFEQTRRHLISQELVPGTQTTPVVIQDESDTVSGEARCGPSLEKVRLPRIESNHV